MRIEPFTYLRPTSLEEACQVLAEHPQACLLSGGTDLMPRLKQQLLAPSHIVDMTDVQGYDYIREHNQDLCVGAGTPLQALSSSELVARQAPLLAEAARKVASQQIRNVATLGGNLCLDTRCWFYNQSRAWKSARPACFKAGGKICHVVGKPDQCYAVFQSDTAPALLALEARVKVISAQGQRVMPIEQLYSGSGQAPLTLAPDELIAEVWIPAPSAGSGMAYKKFSHRRAVDFPLVGVAAKIRLNASQDKIEHACLALSGVGSAPLRAPEAENILMGQQNTETAAEQSAAAAAKASRPVNNLHHGRPSLRRRMVQILTQLAIEEAVQKAR